MKDIVLLPTYDERKNIEKIIPEIFRLYPNIHVLVIDDNSPDNTAGVVKKLMEKYSKLSILERKQKTGLKDAYFDAFERLRKDQEVRSVITMDADCSHSPEYLKDFLANIDNYDLIVGSRYVRGGGVFNWELWRKILSRSGNLYAKLLAGLKINDATSGFMCIKRELLGRVDFSQINSSGYAFLIELKFYLTKRLNASAKEVPIIFYDREEGVTKFSRQIFFEGLVIPWRLFIKRFSNHESLNIGEESWEKYWKAQYSSVNVINFGRQIYNFFLFRFLKKHINKRTDFLELGCGTASLGLIITKKNTSYTGFDFAKNALHQAQANFKKAGCKNYHFELRNVSNFECEKKFDVVWSQGLIEHFDNIPLIIGAHLKACKKGGEVIISVPARYSYHHLWYGLTRFKLLRRFWSWPDQIFISKNMFAEYMRILNINSFKYEIAYLKPRILGLLTLIIKN